MNTLRKAGACGVPLVVSTVIVMLVVGPALPDWAGAMIGYGGLATALLLICGKTERTIGLLILRARPLSDVERPGLTAVLADLNQMGCGPPNIELVVARGRGGLPAVARGRTLIVVAPEIIEATLTGQLPTREVVAVIGHTAVVSRTGMSKQDITIGFWTMPWRILAGVRWPLRRLIAFGWKTRPLVGVIAIVQAFSATAETHGPLNGPQAAVVIASLLAISYLAPWWARNWDRRVTAAGDQGIAELGLGNALASFVRRQPYSQYRLGRIQELTRPPATQKPHLRLVTD